MHDIKITNNNLKKLAELALIRAIPDLTIGKLKPSRTKGLFTKLQKYVDKDLIKINVTQDTINKLEVIINKFGDSTGWFKQTKHTGTLVSFCLGILERTSFDFHPGILRTLVEIIDHFENGNDFPDAASWAGDIAVEKWECLFD